MLEVTSLFKLIYLDGKYYILKYYKNISLGHESCMLKNEAWNNSDYFNWSVDRFLSNSITVLFSVK